jgi:hypothetical protein
MPANLTRLEAITENGELLLETDDPGVRHKAESAGDESKSFVYQANETEEIVNGRVISVLQRGPVFRFTVLPDEAALGP